jgi:NTP pyrophosphatase (non-canonical NTP hydrolase)
LIQKTKSSNKYLNKGKKQKITIIMSNNTTIQQAQEQVDQWIKTIGVKYFSELTNLGILMEEVGELSRIMVRKYGDQSFKNKEEELLLADEMADVLFVLICLANQTGIDLASALEKNILKKTNRDASRHQNNEKLQR